jgi:uncharacterized protein (TIGR02118 family)
VLRVHPGPPFIERAHGANAGHLPNPEGSEAFDAHYSAVHIPLARKQPGLVKYEVGRRPIATPAGDPEPYLIGTLYFESLAAMKHAFATPEGRACAEDRRVLAPEDGDVQMYLFEVEEV